MLTTRFYNVKDYEPYGLPPVEVKDESIAVSYPENYLGDITLSQIVDGRKVEVVTDIAVIHDIIMGHPRESLNEFKNPETGEVITVHLKDLFEFFKVAFNVIVANEKAKTNLPTV